MDALNAVRKRKKWFISRERTSVCVCVSVCGWPTLPRAVDLIKMFGSLVVTRQNVRYVHKPISFTLLSLSLSSSQYKDSNSSVLLQGKNLIVHCNTQWCSAISRSKCSKLIKKTDSLCAHIIKREFFKKNQISSA